MITSAKVVPLTPLSATSSYCSGADFLIRYDARVFGDLVDDTGNRVEASSLPTNTVIVTLLKQASGMVEAACFVGDRYHPLSLQALTGCGLEYLKGLVADLAMGLYFQRRPNPTQKPPAAYEAALGVLEKLRSGERVFGLTEAMDAGVIDFGVLTPEDVERRDLTTQQSRRLFGRRGDRTPLP